MTSLCSALGHVVCGTGSKSAAGRQYADDDCGTDDDRSSAEWNGRTLGIVVVGISCPGRSRNRRLSIVIVCTICPGGSRNCRRGGMSCGLICTYNTLCDDQQACKVYKRKTWTQYVAVPSKTSCAGGRHNMPLPPVSWPTLESVA